MSEQAQPDTEEPGQVSTDEGEGFGSAFAERAGTQRAEQERAADEAAPKEPADEAGSAAAPAAAATDDTPAEPTPPAFDPWAGLTPEQKAHFERLQVSERSQRGRIGALTKKLNGLSAQPPAPQAAPARTEEPAPKAPADGEAPTAADLEARLDAVADEYGDINGPVIEAIKAIRSEIAAIKPKVDQVDLEADSAAMAEAYKVLEGKHPDYATIAEDKTFTDWAAAQPAKVQELITSYDPNEVSLALSLFKAESKASPSATTGDDGEAGSTASDRRRERQLDGSRQVSTRGAPAASGVPNEFGAAFKARAAKAQA